VTLTISAAGIIGRERFIRDPDGKIERQVTTRYRTRVKVPSPVGTQDKYGSCQAPIRRRPARLDINFAWSRIQSVSAHNNQLLCGIEVLARTDPWFTTFNPSAFEQPG
jgi:hypothetical protein